jgi:hypothetical protein
MPSPTMITLLQGPEGNYWSSTLLAGVTTDAWHVGHDNGLTNTLPVATQLNVRCVR